MTREFSGCFFDVNDLGREMILWIYLANGELLRLTDYFRPSVYAYATRSRLLELAADLTRKKFVDSVSWTERQEFWTGQWLNVLELHVRDGTLLKKLRSYAANIEDVQFYNCDLNNGQHYLAIKKLFPLCHVIGFADDHNNLLEIKTTDDPWKLDYSIPEMRIVRLAGHQLQPLSARSSILFKYDKTIEIPLDNWSRAINRFNELITKIDPDIVFSEDGDTVIIPTLLKLAKQSNMRLLLDRDPVITKRKIDLEGRSYFTYGKIVYQGPSYPFIGRWHLDRRNSFIVGDNGLEGLVELARLSKTPMQRMARTTPGTAMTAMQLDRALQENILIPWHKSEPEAPKTVLELLTIDKGGLFYQPPIGAFEGIVEVDFAAQYPSIMVNHNISPETVLCSCCQNHDVPEAGYNICKKRRGLVSMTLKPLVSRRSNYKKLMKATNDPKIKQRYEDRRGALKWCLVSCFGYLGYRNAKFGRIEAHEATTAWGREHLLRAKETAERSGFDVLHALTDSLWLQKQGVSEAEVDNLCDLITKETNITMSLEGIYHWMVFLPSKVNPKRPVPVRFFGMFSDGEMKLRGLACRKHDTPHFISSAQRQLLDKLSGAKSLAECKAMSKELIEMVRQWVAQLREGDVSPEELMIKRTLTKDIDSYSVETQTARAAKKERERGVQVHPGQRVTYVLYRGNENQPDLFNGDDALPRYNVGEYLKLLLKAAGEILNLLCEIDIEKALKDEARVSNETIVRACSTG